MSASSVHGQSTHVHDPAADVGRLPAALREQDGVMQDDSKKDVRWRRRILQCQWNGRDLGPQHER